MFEKLVVITKKTALEELVERFNSKSQAKFYIEHSGASFEDYEEAHDIYHVAVEAIKKMLPRSIKQQFIERSFLPNFLFGEKDLVVTVGPDGLVINTAKYLKGQPILAVNPDTSRIDGILIAFNITTLERKFTGILQGRFSVTNISMACAKLNTGQEIYGVNDIFVGPKKQLSFRYSVEHDEQREDQCSSGIVISTGAGSTGWLKSIIAGSRIIAMNFDGIKIDIARNSQFKWDAGYLYYCVREPFLSRTSCTGLVFGRITKDKPLYLTSQTPTGAVIFSDGIESDFLEFNSGNSAYITVADKKAILINNE